jgi:hypothetical protein
MADLFRVGVDLGEPFETFARRLHSLRREGGAVGCRLALEAVPADRRRRAPPIALVNHMLRDVLLDAILVATACPLPASFGAEARARRELATSCSVSEKNTARP